MFIIPLQFKHRIARRPMVSIGIALLCVVFFWRQQVSETQQQERVEAYCQSFSWSQLALRLNITDLDRNDCVELNMMLLQIDDHDQLMQLIKLDSSEAVSEEYRYFTDSEAIELFRSVTLAVPRDVSFRMAQRSLDWLHPRVLFAQFAHADFWHLAFNIVFFVAFAFAVENVIGPIKMIGLLLVCSAVDGIAYSLFSLISGNRMASLGLSGFVSAVMGALWYLLPWGRIRCLVFVPIPIPFNVPVWVLSAFYFFGDVVALPSMFGDTSVNNLSHVMGALTGYVMGWYWFRHEKIWLNKAMDYELARTWHSAR